MLIVDDESSLRQLLARALTQVGFHCDTAEDGTAALQYCERHDYDLVITDLIMPETNGHAFCIKLLENKKNTPLICVLTGIEEPRIEEDLKKRGIQHLYHKPIDYKQFSQDMLRFLKETKDSAPQETAVKSLSSTPSTTESPSSKNNVVILSPDMTFCRRISLAAADSPLNVIIALSTDHLLEIVNEKRIDLLIVDQEISGFLRGNQIVERLHSDLINIPAFLRGEKITFNHLNIDECEGVEKLIEQDIDERDLLNMAYAYLSRLSQHCLVIDPAARRLVTEFSDVPPIPHVLTRLAERAAQSSLDISIPQLVSEIETDPRLTSELIKVANSSQVASTSKQKDLKGIITLLGPRQAISICLSLGLRTVRSKLMMPWAEDFRNWYLKRTSLIAATAESVARFYENVPPETAYLLGILQDIGILVQAEHYGEAYFERVIKRVRQIPTLQFTTSEYMVTNTDHGMVSAAVLQSWGFPFSIVQPVYAHHQEEQTKLPIMAQGLVRCMRLAEAFAEMCDQPVPQRILKVNTLLAEYYQKSRMEAQDVFLTAIEKTNQMTDILRTPPLEPGELEAIVNQLQISDPQQV
ncbi:HDOD domain-containing protein [Gimesia algae]|uniref:Transcriptional regulatory protein TcrA n=1 Tax=Gimesia algae TaxID=2527971 RepID=A0A517V7X5_9PLAN|nr:HDOD domain-containing protein [Gimesia algae]QDT89104.1 Transcriptional regulatory protein TcrA [Gimesia algae]